MNDASDDQPVTDPDDIGDELAFEADEPGRAKQLILRSTAILPSLFTLANGLLGFGAIHFATKEGLFIPGTDSPADSLANLTMAVWMIFGAMVADMLDGRIARMTRQTTDFGAQLDSLCDAISFGVAPALLMIRTAVVALRGREMPFVPIGPLTERVLWCIGGLYVACAVMRLARFNVENKPDASAHMGFHGLPSPGAAATVAGLILLFAHLHAMTDPFSKALLGIVAVCTPLATFAAALLMVSPFRYVHVVNHYIHGRRPVSYLVRVVLLVLAGVLWPYLTLGVVMLAYALSGVTGALWRRFRPSTQGKKN
ncbi:MAG: phosphatidylcholine/phosphatidylserine synthase [Planctomycetota bacterium]|nr:phosphatidylcholine/phosphatidylserine synthase [Planctomycetota bacterium]